MHLLATSSASLDEIAEPVDLAHEPADMVVASFSDSDLAGLAAAWRGAGDTLPTLRLAPLSELRHPMSVDLWIERTAAHATFVLVRILGGYEWWRYGVDRLASMARERGIALALLPGECRDVDERLIEASTLPRAELDALLAYFREGGPDNLRALLSRTAGQATDEARPLPRTGYYATNDAPAAAPVVPILFYRSMLLAADVAPVDALAAALRSRGLAPLPIFVSSLKDAASSSFVEQALADHPPAAIVTMTAFAAGAGADGETLFDRAGVPVFQAVVATTRREAWADSQRGLAPADLAMHVVLPELDGRILAGAVSFKAAAAPDAALGHAARVNLPEPELVDALADRVARMAALRETPRAERRLAILIPDYPNAPGRAGYAVGLDVPQSVLEMLRDLQAAGYRVEEIPESPRELMRLLELNRSGMSLEDYAGVFAQLPEKTREKIVEAWGWPAEAPISPLVGEMSAKPTEGGPVPGTSQPVSPPSALPGISPTRGEIGRHVFRAATFGNITVALTPDRGRSADRRADYHDPALPPRHELIAFGAWLRETLGAHAIVHVGAHGTLEWLPGKAVALTTECFPGVVTGGLPVVYPFIVSNPGEAAVAKRRIGAVTLGHLPPHMADAGLTPDQQELERLVDEYAQADGLDRRRRDRLARLIVATAQRTGLAEDAGVDEAAGPDEALQRIDAWLCDIKDFALRDGQHVYGRAEGDASPARAESAARERAALVAALDGRHIAAGPSGAPSRGRTDVLPTGRNLYTADPRTMPTPTAVDLGRLAADEVLRRHLQDHGDWPRAVVLDLWGSASLRTGGEEIAQGLALMGCRPQWDAATGRVTGIEVLPLASLGRPRVDVTFRISGLFRDMFPAQIALIDAAVAAVAARGGEGDENPLAQAARTAATQHRVFGTAPGTYGAGIEDLLASGQWSDRAELGRAYLDAASHAYAGAEGTAQLAPGRFATRVAAADLLVHAGDDPGRDLLDGSADVAHVGGFAAALAELGSDAAIITLDTSDPHRPRARSVTEAVTRIVRARATNPRFIAGQMRHGPRGAAEFAETVDRLVGFAETTLAVPARLIEAVHDAYLGDESVRDFMLRENPAAARFIAERLDGARRRGLWHPLRNSVDADLAALIAEARQKEAA
jgi:cobaltochelatase CobN